MKNDIRGILPAVPENDDPHRIAHFPGSDGFLQVFHGIDAHIVQADEDISRDQTFFRAVTFRIQIGDIKSCGQA